MVIEAVDVEPFKTFVRALCFWAPPKGYCRRFPSRCSKCLQENEITIIDPHIAMEFGDSPLQVEDFLTNGDIEI